MADNLTNLDPWGKPKRNAWNWLFYSYILITIFFFAVFPVAYIKLWGTWDLLMPAILSVVITFLCVFYGITQYKELVDGNYILPFSRSNINGIFNV